jgi:homogentisate 1,2-dioxygenase
MSYECGFVPHGVAYEEWKAATEMELKPERISEGTIAFMFESSRPFTITDFAFNRSGVKVRVESIRRRVYCYLTAAT